MRNYIFVTAIKHHLTSFWRLCKNWLKIYAIVIEEFTQGIGLNQLALAACE
jgi:hypothetical protein